MSSVSFCFCLFKSQETSHIFGMLSTSLQLLKTESEGVLTNSPVLSSDVMMEMLLDCVQGKTTLQSSDLLGLIKDLGPEVSPDLEGFQHSIMCIR